MPEKYFLKHFSLS